MTENRRVFHTATLLGSGKVLIASGEDQIDSPVDSSKFFDPSTAKFAVTVGSLNETEVFEKRPFLSERQYWFQLVF